MALKPLMNDLNHLNLILVHNKVVQISRPIFNVIKKIKTIYDAENANTEMHMWDSSKCACGWEKKEYLISNITIIFCTFSQSKVISGILSCYLGFM